MLKLRNIYNLIYDLRERNDIKKWQKVKQYLYVMNVDMNQQNGLENVQDVIVGIVFFEQKVVESKNSILKARRQKKK